MEFPKISLAAARVNANMTADEAAKALRISKHTLLNWEHGITEPKHSQFIELCELYKFPGQFIFFN